MRIAYHFPSLNNIYAQRTVYHGYKNAFTDLGHEFYTFTADDRLEMFLAHYSPDIFITSSHFYYQKYLNFNILKKYRDRGMKLFTKIDFWRNPMDSKRINEARSLKDDKKTVALIKEGLLGDMFFHVVEQGDERMDGFEQTTGYKYYTIPLAADKMVMKYLPNKLFMSNISFVGTYLPEKREFFKKYVFPLAKKYNLRIYGQDWTLRDRALGWIQRVGQYFNIPYVRSIQKPKLQLEDEAKIYSSSTISINVHEEYQRHFGGDCNERTFKIPLCGGFEITDDVACIRKYFEVGKEIIIVENKDDWFEKIKYYLENPDKREAIIQAGKERILRDHTYHERVGRIIEIYNKI